MQNAYIKHTRTVAEHFHQNLFDLMNKLSNATILKSFRNTYYMFPNEENETRFGLLYDTVNKKKKCAN